MSAHHAGRAVSDGSVQAEADRPSATAQAAPTAEAHETQAFEVNAADFALMGVQKFPCELATTALLVALVALAFRRERRRVA